MVPVLETAMTRPSPDEVSAMQCTEIGTRGQAPRPAPPGACPGTDRLLPSPSMEPRLLSHSAATRQGARVIGL